jgi:hypothetical protein
LDTLQPVLLSPGGSNLSDSSFALHADGRGAEAQFVVFARERTTNHFSSPGDRRERGVNHASWFI